MDRLAAMAVLAAAVEEGSLSAAGRRLGMPLATVSRKISELEAHVRTRLLTRTSRRLILTEAGERYVADCRRILAEVEEAERAASGEYSAPKGELTITAPIVFGRLYVLPVALDFLRAYPHIDLRMELTDRVANVVEEHLDAAVRIAALPDSSLVATRIGSIRRVTCASPRYLAAHGTPRRPSDLRAHDCITFGGLASSQRWTFTTGKSHAPFAVHSRLTVSTAEAAIDACLAGLGIACVLSYQVAPWIASGKLVTVLGRFAPADVPVSLVFSRQRLLAQKIRAFVDFATPRLRTAMENADRAVKREKRAGK